MSKYSKIKIFYLTSICSVFVAAAVGKLLFILYKTASSDVMITGASSFFLRSLPYISSFGAELFSRGAFVMAVCSAVYAISFFGKKTGGKSILFSILCLCAGEALLFLYNITRNVVGKAGVIAWLLSTLIEIFVSCILLGIAFFIAYRFAVYRFHAPRQNRLKRYSPLRAALLSLGIACLLHIVILSTNKVIPFFLKYQNISLKETMDIIYDYGYYIFWHLGISFALTYPCLKVLEKTTGRLQPKDYKADLSNKNNI